MISESMKRSGKRFGWLSAVVVGSVTWTSTNVSAGETNLVGWGLDADGQATVPPSIGTTATVAAGWYHNVALIDGGVVCWGRNFFGQCEPPVDLGPVAAVDAGGSHSVALQVDGTVRCWGGNDLGQCDTPADLVGVVSVKAGGFHTVALLGDGTVVCWGSNDDGQSTVPVDLPPVVAIDAGLFHTVAILDDGTVRAWGDDTYGQSSPPKGLFGVVEVAAGGLHTLALLDDGTVRAWGDDFFGQVLVPDGIGEARSIAAGGFHSIVLAQSGTMTVWGDDSYEQSEIPLGLPPSTSVVAGGFHSIAVGALADGDLDGDGVPNASDNCLFTPNPDQNDCNGNGIGDVCDATLAGDPDCDQNGIADGCDLSITPERDFNANGILDVCEGLSFWLPLAGGDPLDPGNWSGGVPSKGVVGVVGGPDEITLETTGGAFEGTLEIAGTVVLEIADTLATGGLKVPLGGALTVIGHLSVEGDATVDTGGRLAIRHDGYVEVGGTFDARQQSSLSFGLQRSEIASLRCAAGSFEGGVEVGLGILSPWTLQLGEQFRVIATDSLLGTGFFGSLLIEGIGSNILQVVGSGLLGIERFDLEVISLAELIESENGSSSELDGTPSAIAVGPLTDDLFDDVAVTVEFGPSDSGLLYLLESDGAGGFAGQAVYNTDPGPSDVGIGRLDADGRPDLAVAASGSNTLRPYINGDGTIGGIQVGAAVSTPDEPIGLAIVKLGIDGVDGGSPQAAVLVSCRAASIVQAYAAAAAGGGLAPGGALPTVQPPGPIDPIDVETRETGGAAVALPATANAPTGEVLVIDVSTEIELSIASTTVGPPAPVDLASGDLNGDAFPDVVVVDEGGSLSILRGTAVGLGQSGSFVAGSVAGRDAALGDFNGDGRADLIVALGDPGAAETSSLELFRNESVVGGPPTFQPAGSFGVGDDVQLLEAGRFVDSDNDGIVTVDGGVPGAGLQGGGVVIEVVLFESVPVVPCLGDLDGSGGIGSIDVSLLLGDWGEPGLGDLNGDEITDAVDLAILLIGWGPCGNLDGGK